MDTDFQDFSKRRKSFFFPIMKASSVAKIGYKALMKGKRVVIPGISNKIQVFLMRFIPRILVSKLTGLMVAK
jgi:short-subunit dehydrogenase